MRKSKKFLPTIKDYVKERLDAYDLPAEVGHICELKNCHIKDVYPERDKKDPGEGIYIPYIYGVDGPRTDKMSRVRYYYRPPLPFGAIREKEDKYVQEAEYTVVPYIPPFSSNLENLIQAKKKDGRFSILVPEGEFKAIMVAYLVSKALELGMEFPHGLIPVVIGIPGAAGWHGSSKLGRTILPELKELCPRATTFIALDRDCPPKPQVLFEEVSFAKALFNLRSTALRVSWAEKAKGIDDCLNLGRTLEEKINILFKLLEHATLFETYSDIQDMNKKFAYILREQAVWDLERRILVKPSEFLRSYFPGVVKIPKSLSAFFKALDEGEVPKYTEVKKTTLWIDSPARLELDRFEFMPGKSLIVDDVSNTFYGWGIATPLDKPILPKKGNINPFLKFYEEALSGHSWEEKNWLLQCIAFKVQHPMELLSVYLGIVGPPSSGKTKFLELIEAVIGRLYVSKPSAKELIGDFNSYLTNKLIVNLNDSDLKERSERKELMMKLKNITGEEYHNIHRKFKDSYLSPCYPLITISSNDPIPLEPDDRRCGIFEFSKPNKTVQELDAWEAWRSDKVNYPALLDYFMTYSLKSFRPTGDAPHTAARDISIEEELTFIEMCLHKIKQTGSVVLTKSETGNGSGYKKISKLINVTACTTEDLALILKAQHPQIQHLQASHLGSKMKRYGGFFPYDGGKTVRIYGGNKPPNRVWIGLNSKHLLTSSLTVLREEYKKFKEECEGYVTFETVDYSNVINLNQVKKRKF